MLLKRVVLLGLAAAFTVGMTSFASAGGWGWGGGWGGGWGAGWGGGWGSGFGCGGCAAPSAAFVYAQPVAPLPPPLPVVTGGCGCGCGCGHQSVVYAAPPIEPTPIAPAPIYVVNQGPAYEGPGITVPFHTWAPVSGYGPVVGHGYGLGYGRHFGYGHRWGYGYRPRLAYHRPFIGYPHRRWPVPMYRGPSYPWNK